MPGADSIDSGAAASQIAAIASLNDPIRRALYAYIAQSPGAVGRDEAAAAVGISRELAAFHLDKLLEEGLLDVEYRRLSGRSGPGAGRPNKLYRPSGREVRVVIPERRYDLIAQFMAEGLENPGRDAAAAVGRAARRFGETLGADAGQQLGRRASQSRVLETACAVLRDYGFDPVQQSGEIRLRNCPFEAVARDHTALVCGMNLAFAEGLLAGLGAERVEVRLDPMPGTCCVAVTPVGRKSRPGPRPRHA